MAEHGKPLRAVQWYDLILRPGLYFHHLQEHSYPWKLIGVVYALSMVAASVFYSQKPLGFPPQGLSAELEQQSFLFWMVISCAGLLLTLAVAWLSKSILRFLGSSMITLPQMLLVMMGSHVYYLIMFALLGGACLAKSPAFYQTSELFFSFAGLIFTVRGIRFVGRVTIPKAFLSILLSSLLIIAVIVALSMAKILPSPIFKALLLI